MRDALYACEAPEALEACEARGPGVGVVADVADAEAETGIAEARAWAACAASATPSAVPRQTIMQTARDTDDGPPGVHGRPRSIHRRAWVSMRRDPSLFFIG